MLFNKYSNGGEELRELLGFVAADTNFSKWLTWIELSVRQITALTGPEVYKVADDHYHSDHYLFSASGTLDETTTPKASEIAAWVILDGLVRKMQLANGLFAYVRLLPSLDSGHSNSGRKKSVGETERALTAVEAYKDESNILNLGYEALEDLLSYMEVNAIQSWLDSDTRKSTANLLVPDLATFNRSFKINSARLFYTLVPMLWSVQKSNVAATVTQARITAILEAVKATTPTEEQVILKTLLTDFIQEPMVMATMAMALERLPIEVLPEGLVQVSIVGTVKEKQAAANEVRLQMISSFRRDAERGFNALQEQIAVLEGALATERYVEPPTVNENIKGFRF